MTDQRADDDLVAARLSLCQAAAVLARLECERDAEEPLDVADLARAEAHTSEALGHIQTLGARHLL